MLGYINALQQARMAHQARINMASAQNAQSAMSAAAVAPTAGTGGPRMASTASRARGGTGGGGKPSRQASNPGALGRGRPSGKKMAAGGYKKGMPTVTYDVASLIDESGGHAETLANWHSVVKRAARLASQGYRHSGMLNVLVGPSGPQIQEAGQGVLQSQNASVVTARYQESGADQTERAQMAHAQSMTPKDPLPTDSSVTQGGSWAVGAAPMNIGGAAGANPKVQIAALTARTRGQPAVVPQEPNTPTPMVRSLRTLFNSGRQNRQ